jgi:hypothetical protein
MDHRTDIVEENRRRFPERSIWSRSIPRAALAFALIGVGPALAAPANSLQELYAQLGACIRGVAGEPGAQLTIAFSLRRDGSLFGKPHISYSRLPTDPAARENFLEGVADSFGRCTPVAITDALGGAIAGRPLTVRFVIPRVERSS